MGGSDPFELTLRCARRLPLLIRCSAPASSSGRAWRTANASRKQIVSLGRNFETIEGADDLATEYATADLALAAFGVTAYELAAFGVPALYLCLNDDHALSASAFEQAGIGVSLGVAETTSDAEIADGVRRLSNDAARRRDMRAAGLMTIDGEGHARIAADLSRMLRARRAGVRAAL